MQLIGPVSDDLVLCRRPVVDLILEDVVASGSVTVLVEGDRGPRTSCKKRKEKNRRFWHVTCDRVCVFMLNVRSPGEVTCFAWLLIRPRLDHVFWTRCLNNASFLYRKKQKKVLCLCLCCLLKQRAVISSSFLLSFPLSLSHLITVSSPARHQNNHTNILTNSLMPN